jgi:excisionase family DNA binding protein
MIKRLLRRGGVKVAEKYFTYEELAERWKVAVNTLRQWVMSGVLVPSMRLGRLVRFSESYIIEIESKGGLKNVG